MAGKNAKTAGLMDDRDAAAVLPRREAGAHKWSVGGLVIVGGAPGYIGAPALCARAAMRSGAGIVSVAVSRSSIGPIAGIVPEATFIPLPDGDPPHAARKARALIGERTEKSAALVIGPGLSDDDHATALLGALFGFAEQKRSGSVGFGIGAPSGAEDSGDALVGNDKPAVIDADGLNWLATQPEWWTRVKPQTLLLTPHAGEMARLTGAEAAEIAGDPETAAVAAAAQWNQTVLLKGTTAVLTNGADTIRVDDIPRSLASAGTGDVLAGAVGAFLAQGLSLIDAGRLAIFAGVNAARDAKATYGTLGLMASDLPEAIARVLVRLERS
ncbi:MAG: NAD(P)H-hydrate dehydratase [Thermomicrobiales bacterium]|nr:NAD(P)H-hydrate dehydratase [Thermomicrobiales bacterium]